MLHMTAMDAGERDAYTIISRFYDLEYDTFEADLELYRQFAQRAAGPVLELGCGTGRVLRALTDLGLPLTGVDISQAMLDVARRRLPDTVELLARDMQWIFEPRHPANAPFALAFVAINTFLHLPDVNSQLETLAGVREVTADDGLLILDIFAPDPAYIAELDGRLLHKFNATLDDGSRLDRWALNSHDLASQTIDTTVFFDVTQSDGSVRRYVDHYLTRYIHRFELEHLLERAGWRMVSLFGSYGLDPYDSDSERMLVLATPANELDELGGW